MSKANYNAVLDIVLADTDNTEPVSVQEVKDFGKIDTGTDEDTIIGYLITTARQQCEDFTGISLKPRTVTTVLTNLCGGIYLPYCPYGTLTSIVDSDGTAIDSTNYTISGTQFPQLITPTYERIKMVYTAGYTSANLPQEIKTAILQQTFYLYENRGESAQITRSGMVAELTLSPQAKATLQRFRRV